MSHSKTFFVLFSLVVASYCFQDDSLLVLDDESYKNYPPMMFEALEFRNLSPEERKASGGGMATTGTDFLRPFAKKPFKRNEIILSIPLSSGINGETIASDIPILSEITFSYVEEPFVAWILYHRSLGSSSPHKTFIDSIPRQFINPLTFTNEQWGSLAVDYNSVRMNQIVNSDRELLFKTRLVLIRNLEEHGNAEDLISILTESADDYLWAYVAVKDLIRQTPAGLYIFPAMKFSHSPNAQAPIFSEDSIQVIASTDIDVGDQIFINYGNITNHELILHHSLFIEGNAQDCAFFSVNAKNPYWLLVAEKVFGYTSSTYDNCLPVSFQPRSDVLKEMRTVVASDEELDQLDSILAGNSVSIENEAHMLRALYYSLKAQGITAEVDLPDPNGDASIEFWNNYTKEHQKVISNVLARIMELWGLYL